MQKNWILIFFLFLSAAAFGQTAADKYVELYKEAAIRIMNENGILASIVLGVAIHESGSGTSEIARILNNHFGFKGQNQSKEIHSAYKGYDSVEASYADFVNLLKERDKFRPLFDKYSSFDYYGWVTGIQRAGYASSTAWANQVLAIIKKYELYQYDNRPAGYVDAVPEPVNTSPQDSPRDTANPNANATDFFYKVKAGDTLLKIAKQYHTTVKNIKDNNALKTTHLSIGEKLKLQTGQ